MAGPRVAPPGIPDLAPVTKLSSNVTRVLGMNPSAYTLQGTNTYLVGPARSLFLIDTGEGWSEYVEHLRSALRGYGDDARVSDIILTHWHHDHIGGLPDVLNILQELRMPPPKIWKLPSPEHDHLVSEILDKIPSKAFSASTDGKALTFDLRDRQTLDIGNGTLEVVHTPGHTTDSICLLYPEERVFFTADTVLGHGTAVFEDLRAYMASLKKMISVLDGPAKVKLYCGHGDVIDDGKAKLKEYLEHRQLREDQVVEVLGQASGDRLQDEPVNAVNITKAIYLGKIPDSLLDAAARGVLLHLEKLEADGRAERVGKGAEEGPIPGWNDTWRLKSDRASQHLL